MLNNRLLAAKSAGTIPLVPVDLTDLNVPIAILFFDWLIIFLDSSQTSWEQQTLIDLVAPVLPRSLKLQQAQEKQIFVIPSCSLFKIVCTGDHHVV
jgi:hypothetical protein